MPLIRCSCQPSESLEAYFRRIHGNVDGNTLKHTPMVDVIRAFESAFPETTIYGLTSMFWLILLPEDDWRVQWLIRCGVNEEEDGKFEFTVEYLLPDSRNLGQTHESRERWTM